MLNKIESFESNLEDMENELKPLSESTAEFIMAKERISKTLVEVGKTHTHFRVTGSVKGIAYQGYSPDRAKEVFTAIDRLNKAKEFFEMNREMRSAGSFLVQINHLLSLLVGSCVKEVSQHFEALGPSVTEDHTTECGECVAVSSVSDDIIASVHPVIDMLLKINSTEHLEIYLKVRKKSILLQLEEEHKRKLNLAAWKDLLRGSSSSSSGGGGHQHQQQHQQQHHHRVKTNAVFGRYFAFCTELLRGEVTMWSALLSQTGQSLDVFVQLCMEVVDKLRSLMAPFLAVAGSGGSGGNRGTVIGSVSGSTNMTRKEVLEITAGADGVGRSEHDLCLIRLEMMQYFIGHFDGLYEVCKPDFRRDSDASLALLELRGAVVGSCVRGLERMVALSADAGPTLTPEVQSSAADKTDTANGGVGVGGSNQTALFNASNAGERCGLQSVLAHSLHFCGEMLTLGSTVVSDLSKLAVSVGQNDTGGGSPAVRSLPMLLMAILQNLRTNIMQRGEFISAAVFVMASKNVMGKKGGGSTLSDITRETFFGDHHGGGNKQRGSMEMSLTERASSIFNSKAHLDRAATTHGLYHSDGDKEDALVAIMDACQYLFLLNNLVYLHAFMLDRGGDLSLCLSSSEPKFVEVFTEEVAEALNSSKESFCAMLATNVGMTAADDESFNTKYASAPSSDKQGKGRLLKGKFAIFNCGLEALLTQQGAWKVSAPSLRDEMGMRIKDAIYPIYNTFYQEYSGTNFSKRHMDQYVKHTPEDVKTLLLRFFSGNS
jgi:hypothetical protein